MLDDIAEALRMRYGADWIDDTDANIRFALEAERLVADVEFAHLISEPELEDDRVTMRFWVDQPVPDLMTGE